MASTSRAATLLSTFQGYRAELDEHQARRERIIKLSRDVTALSKKVIFALHRITTRDRQAVFAEAEAKFGEIRVLLDKLGPELQGEDFWRYEKSVAPGLEEFMEAYTFYFYLQHHALPDLATSQEFVVKQQQPAAQPAEDSTAPTDATPTAAQDSQPKKEGLRLTPSIYLGGVSDLTGELMRLAIASVGRSLGGAESEGESIDSLGRFVREIKGEMAPLAVHVRYLDKKLAVLDQSLAKIEATSYHLSIRKAEYRDRPELLAAYAQRLATQGGAPVAAGGPGGGDD